MTSGWCLRMETVTLHQPGQPRLQRSRRSDRLGGLGREGGTQTGPYILFRNLSAQADTWVLNRKTLLQQLGFSDPLMRAILVGVGLFLLLIYLGVSGGGALETLATTLGWLVIPAALIIGSRRREAKGKGTAGGRQPIHGRRIPKLCQPPAALCERGGETGCLVPESGVDLTNQIDAKIGNSGLGYLGIPP